MIESWLPAQPKEGVAADSKRRHDANCLFCEHERYGSLRLYSFLIGVVYTPPVSKSLAPRPRVLSGRQKHSPLLMYGIHRSCAPNIHPCAPVSYVGNGGAPPWLGS